MLIPSQLTLIKRCQQQGEKWRGATTNYQKFMNDSAKWVGWEEAGVRPVSLGEQVGGFPGLSGDLGLRDAARGHAVTSVMVTVASAALSHCWAPSLLRRPSGHCHGCSSHRQLQTGPHNVIFLSSRHTWGVGLTHLLCENSMCVLVSMWFPGHGSRPPVSTCSRAFAAMYLHRKRSRWLCRQRACVCQPMEQERLEGLLLRGGAETQGEASGVGGWGRGGSDGVGRPPLRSSDGKN